MDNYSTKLTIGMDLGDKKHWIAILDESGNLTEKTTCVNTAECIQNFFRRFDTPSQITIGMESGTHSPWLSRLLEKMGFRVLIGNARKLRAIWQSDVKDDGRDSIMLARIARFDPSLMHPIYHRGEKAQADLAILRARDALVSARTSLINTCRGLVKSWGSRLPSCSADAFAKVVPGSVPEELEMAVMPLVKQIGDLTQRIKAYDRRLAEISSREYPETAILTQVTGVGPVTSLAFVLTVENPERFTKNRSIGPFLGLTPKRDQSGETDKDLPITKAGDEFVRRLLAQSAQFILGPFGPDCELRRHGERIRQKGGKASNKKAVTAVSRKLAVLLLHLWKTGDNYDPFHRQTIKNKKSNAA